MTATWIGASAGLVGAAGPATSPSTTAPSAIPSTGPSAAPATAPAAEAKADDARVRALIDQLGGDDPAAREAATRELTAIGRAAVPALQAEADGGSPEVRARARELIRLAGRRLPPGPPPKNGLSSSRSVSSRTGNGRRTVEVNDDGYRVAIEETPGQVKLDVTGVRDGRPATESYTAADADQLRRENPEAFAVYEKYRGQDKGGRIDFGGVGGFARGVGPGAAGGPAADAARREADARLRRHLQEQVDNPELPEGARQQLRDMVRRIDERNPPAPAGAGAAADHAPATRPAGR